MSEQGSSGRSASEIVSAAERLAEEITRGARAEAEAIRARAGGESEQARAATRERIGRLGEIAEAMQRQLTQMRSELDALAGSLGTNAAVPVRGLEPEHVSAEATGAAADVSAETHGIEPADVCAEAPVSDPDEVAARLVALNMAMNDAPREETARYLREHHSLSDPERLLDEVYAGAGR
ncbi:MAG TPA: hypothetical protein VFW09_10670 [Solirubrobacteraceae bacterium]|jgi:hypothetical protein|nr:hypothetical protein [Solirubrobacteraceae bacterium]